MASNRTVPSSRFFDFLIRLAFWRYLNQLLHESSVDVSPDAVSYSDPGLFWKIDRDFFFLLRKLFSQNHRGREKLHRNFDVPFPGKSLLILHLWAEIFLLFLPLYWSLNFSIFWSSLSFSGKPLLPPLLCKTTPCLPSAPYLACLRLYLCRLTRSVEIPCVIEVLVSLQLLYCCLRRSLQ